MSHNVCMLALVCEFPILPCNDYFTERKCSSFPESLHFTSLCLILFIWCLLSEFANTLFFFLDNVTDEVTNV